MPTPKIATCCYCGSRTMLELRGRVHHELSCSSCGAPLRYIKMLRKEAETPRHSARDDAPRAAYGVADRPTRPTQKKSKKKSKSRGLLHRVIAHIADEIEDLID